MRHRVILLISFILFIGLGVIGAPRLLSPRDQIAVAYGDPPQQIFHLSRVVWQVQGVSGGGGYKLVTLPLSPSGTGTQCCCTYMPCLLKQP